MHEFLTYDDVNIVPKYSEVLSRNDCDTTVKLMEDVYLTVPIMSSPMDTVTETEMVLKMAELGGMGVLHRFMSIEEQVSSVKEIIDSLKESGTLNIPNKFAVAVGVKENDFTRVEKLYDAGTRIFLLDVAHGHHLLVKIFMKELRDQYGTDIKIIAGSISTQDAAYSLIEWGADALRIGQGNGSLCETRTRTGIKNSLHIIYI